MTAAGKGRAMQVDGQRVPERRGSRANMEATRQAALDLFVRNGFEATSMREVARQVGVSAATIYNYTESKESLLWDLVRQVRQDLDALRALSRQQSGCPADVLREALATMTRYHVEHARECHVLSTAAGALAPEHARQLSESLAEEVTFFAELVRAVWPESEVQHDELRVTVLMLMESAKLGSRAVEQPTGVDESLPMLVARFGLRSVGVRLADHASTCPDPGQCAVSQLDQP
ncbi:TetR/AcrR family transcriptional regulator [Nocardioides sp. AE5]|uniref:TetR/AcrR family transcriptional regulator n=1 Tax=Nocardioides sp. AE5 TaxID=2962573 RepID=UPI002881E296|nr:TetR/AcrR family transcriptional regulator [Nocardioides sp. AE5]MDT0202724.1 TetR/AcrR family transcriptional regulator [Nocardioides sp. AE5]